MRVTISVIGKFEQDERHASVDGDIKEDIADAVKDALYDVDELTINKIEVETE